MVYILAIFGMYVIDSLQMRMEHKFNFVQPIESVRMILCKYGYGATVMVFGRSHSTLYAKENPSNDRNFHEIEFMD